MHDEHQRPLQAVENSEDIYDPHVWSGLLSKQESTKHPHKTQDTHLGYSCDCERSAEDKGEERGDGVGRGESEKGQQIENERKD